MSEQELYFADQSAFDAFTVELSTSYPLRCSDGSGNLCPHIQSEILDIADSVDHGELTERHALDRAKQQAAEIGRLCRTGFKPSRDPDCGHEYLQ